MIINYPDNMKSEDLLTDIENVMTTLLNYSSLSDKQTNNHFHKLCQDLAKQFNKFKHFDTVDSKEIRSEARIFLQDDFNLKNFGEKFLDFSMIYSKQKRLFHYLQTTKREEDSFHIFDKFNQLMIRGDDSNNPLPMTQSKNISQIESRINLLKKEENVKKKKYFILVFWTKK